VHYYKKYISPIAVSLWRTKGIIILYGVGAVLGIGFFGGILYYGGGHRVAIWLQVMVLITMPFTGLILFLSSSVVALELAKQVFENQRLSLFRVRSRGEIGASVALLVVAVGMWMATLAILLTVLLTFSMIAGLSVAETTNIVYFTVLRLGGATLVATLLGLLLGKTTSRTVGYSVIVAVLVFMTPAVGSILGGLTSASSYTVRLVSHWALIAPFELPPPMVGAPPDSMYLLPAEPHQWLLPAIWIVSILVGLVFSLRKVPQASVLAALLAFVLMITPWAAYGAHIALPRVSQIALHDITEMSLNIDLFVEGASTSPDNVEPIPTVARYKMDLGVCNKLSGRVTVVLDEPFGEQPVFTLFRGYRVWNITDGEGNKLDFSQEGNHITILSPAQDEAVEFVFEYSGSGWGNYANQQGIFLAGSVPWYPWPGRQRFYGMDFRHELQPASHILRRGAVEEIRVRVRSPFAEIHTPQGVVLTRSEDFVSVPTESLTLFAGNVRKAGDRETFVVYGGEATLERFEIPEFSDVNVVDKQNREEILERALSLRQLMGLEGTEALQVDAVVLVPSYPAFSNLFDFPVFKDDYVLIDGETVVDYPTMFAMQGIPQGYAKRDVWEALFFYLNDPEFFLSENPGMSSDTEEYRRSSRVGNMITDLVRTRGDEYALSQITAYLMDESRTESGEEFLASLLEGGEVEGN